MRAALDVLVQQLVLANGGTATRDTSFPIAKSAESFETQLHRKVKGTSEEAATIIRRLKPYKGGNSPLWCLHQVDIADKHHMVIPVGAFMPGMIVAEAGPSLSNRPFQTIWGQTFPLEDGVEVARVGAHVERPDVYMASQGRFRIAFGQPEIIKGKFVMPTLAQLGQYTEGVIKAFIPLLT